MSGDIGTLLKYITETSQLTPADFIKKTVGSMLYVYYAYVDTFKQTPVDLDDLVDGLLYIEARNYNEERHLNQGQKE